VTPYVRIGVLAVNEADTLLEEAAQLETGQQAGAARLREEALTVMKAAEEPLDTALGIDPDNVEALVAMGKVDEALGRPDEALKLYKDVLRLDPANLDATLAMAQTLQARGVTTGSRNDLLDAIDYYRRADGMRGLSPLTRAAYGNALLQIGDLEDAARVLQANGTPEPETPAARLLDRVRTTEEQLRQIEAQAAATMQANPNSEEGILLSAQALIARGQLQQSVYLIDRVLQNNPASTEAWVTMGLVKGYMAAEESFVNHYEAPWSLDTKVSPWLNLAGVCGRSNQWQAAEKYLELGGQRDTTLPKPLIAVGEVALELQQGSRAVAYFERATEAYPDDPTPWLRLCDMAIASKNLPTAMSALDRAEKLNAPAEALAERRAKVGTAPAAAAPGGAIIQ
jgi:tetratricopeptide (TPR) repeat protein